MAFASLAQVIVDLDIDLVLIQEPYAFSATHPVIPNVPTGYSTFHALTEDHAYGSAIIARDLIATKFNLKNKHFDNHVACVELTTDDGPLCFCSLYLRPSEPTFLSSATTIFDSIGSTKAVYGVDSNARNPVWNSITTDVRGAELETLLHFKKLNIANVAREHLVFVPTSTSFVDLTLYGDRVDIQSWSFLSIPSLSNHPYIFFEVNSVKPVPPKAKRTNPPFPKLCSINQVFFNELLLKESKQWNKPLCLPPISEIEELVDKISFSIEKCAKLSKTPRISQIASCNMPWWSDELRLLRNSARHCHRILSRSNTNDNRSNYKNARAIYQKALRSAKNKSFADFRTAATTTDTFKALSEFTNNKKTISFPDTLIINGIPTSDPSTIINGCADHFFPSPMQSSCYHDDLESNCNTKLVEAMTDSIPRITNWELDAAIASLNTKSAAGFDGLTTAMVVHCLPIIKPYLMLILNAYIVHSFFPEKWKISKVNIIGKPNKQSYSDLQSFRPISLAGSFSKILEKIILGRLQWLAKSQDWLSPDQHGFRSGKSTETAVHSLVTGIENGFSAKEVTACAFLDIKSAFDSAWHPAIVTARDFLTGRKAVLTTHGISITIPVNLGCPQGGVLSPFLWIVLIDDILRLSFPFPYKILAFADDLTISTTHPSPSHACLNLQIVCDSVNQKLRDIKLNLNALKTVLMIFSKRRTKLPKFTLIVNGNQIHPSETATLLGFIMDPQLKWTYHIKAKIVSAKRALFAVNNCIRNTWGSDHKKLRFLYTTAVEPILTYGCAIWVSALKRKAIVKQLRSFQRTVGLLLTKSLKTASTESIILLSDITPIDHVIIRNAACRLLSNRDEPFTPSSYQFLNNTLLELASIEKSDKSESPFSGFLPPWDFGFNISCLPKHIVVPLLPSDENTVHVYSVITQSSGLTVSGIVATNHTGVISSQNFCFKSNKTKYNSRLTFQKVLGIAFSLSHTESIIDSQSIILLITKALPRR